MSTNKDATIHFSEAVYGVGPAYLEIRFPKGREVDGQTLLYVRDCFLRTVKKSGISPQSIDQGTTRSGEVFLRMELPQYTHVQRKNYINALDSCAFALRKNLSDDATNRDKESEYASPAVAMRALEI